MEILWEKFQKSGNQDRCKPLQKQYRMNKEISSYPFSKWYKSIDIENDESIENRKLEYENNDWENDVFKKIKQDITKSMLLIKRNKKINHISNFPDSFGSERILEEIKKIH